MVYAVQAVCFPPWPTVESNGGAVCFLCSGPLVGEVSGQSYTYTASDFFVEIHRAPTAYTYS